MNPADVILLLAFKSLILGVAILLVWGLFNLLPIRSPQLHRIIWGGVLLLGLFGAGFPVSIPVSDVVDTANTNTITATTTPKQNPVIHHNDTEQPFAFENSLLLSTEEKSLEAGVPFAEKHDSANIEMVAQAADSTYTWSEWWQTNKSPLFAAALCVWLVGVVLLFVRRLLQYGLLQKHLKSAMQVQGNDAELWQRVLAERHIAPEKLSLFITQGIGPALVRTWNARAAIVVPNDLWMEATDRVKSGILRHELTHYVQHDLVICELVRSLAVLHWFNPLAWLAMSKFEEATEWSCDVAAFGNHPKGELHFAESILALHDVTPSITLKPYTFSGGKLTQRARLLKAIINQPKESVMKKLTVLIFAALLLTAGAIRIGFVAHAEQKQDENVVLSQSGENAGETPSETKQPETTAIPDSVTVTIVDENEKPMKDVLLKVRLVRDEKEFRSDENGKVVVDTKPYQNTEAGWFVFEAYAPDRVSTVWRWLRRKENPTSIPSEFTIRLNPGYTIGGVVVDEQGKPVAGAKVVPSYNYAIRSNNMYADTQIPRPIWEGVRTDAEGKWKADGYSSSNGQIRIAVTHDEFLPSVEDNETKAYVMDDILSGKAKTVLKSGFHVHGTISDPQGKPIPQAVITFDHPGVSNLPSAVRTTDENGRFEVKAWYKKSTKYSVVHGDWAPVFGTMDYAASEYKNPKDTQLDFSLKKGKTIRMKVVDPNGNQIKQFWVCFHSDQPYMEDAFPSGPNAEGIWEWNNAPDAGLAFDVDSMQGFDRIYDIKMKPREEAYVVTARGTTVVIGTVIDAETKKPIEKVDMIKGMLRLKPHPDYSDESWMRESPILIIGGTFSMNFDSEPEPEDASRVRYNALRFEAIGYEPFELKPIDLDGKTQNHSIELKPSQSKPVQAVVLLQNGKPAVDAEVGRGGSSGIAVRTENDRIAGNTGNPVVRTDAMGQFEFPNPGVEYVILVAHPDGFAFARQKEVETGTIRLIPWACIEGTAYDDGKPAAGVSLWGTFNSKKGAGVPRPLTYEARLETRTDAEGKFVIPRVAPDADGLIGFTDETADTKIGTESGKTSTIRVERKN